MQIVRNFDSEMRSMTTNYKETFELLFVGVTWYICYQEGIRMNNGLVHQKKVSFVKGVACKRSARFSKKDQQVPSYMKEVN